MFAKLKELATQTIVYGLSGVLNQVVSVLTAPVFLHYFTPADYGIMAMVSTTAGLLGLVLGLGMGPAIFRQYYDCSTEVEKQELFTTALILLLISSAAILVPAVILSSEISRLVLSMDGAKHYLVIKFTAMLLGPLSTVPKAFFRAEKKARQYAIVSIAVMIVNVLLSLVLAVVMDLRVMGALLADLFASVVVVILIFPSLVRNLRLSINTSRAKRLLSFGIPIGLGLLPMYLIDVADRYFLRSFSTLEQVGLYSVAYKFPWIIKGMIVQSFVLAWGPFVVSMKDQRNAKEAIAVIATGFLLVLLGVTLAFSLLSPEILKVFAAPEFWSAYRVVPILCLSYSIYGLYYIFNAGIYVTQKTQYVPAVIGFAMMVNLAANFLLVPRHGMMGAAIATFLAHATMAGGMFVVSLRLYPLKLEFNRIGKLLLAAGLVYAASLLPRGEMSIALSVTMKFGLLMLYPVLLLVLRFFEPREIARARLLLAKYTPDFVRALL